MFDPQSADNYDRWFATSEGRFALEQEKRLIQHLVSGWPRRRQSLLEIGCGTGIFLEMFWEYGFDIYGLDSSPDMLQKAREKLGNKADLHLGNAECLPFEDNEFDFVAMITVLEFCKDQRQVLAEAGRVARKGLLICFLNKNSLYHISHKLLRLRQRDKLLVRARWHSYREIKALVHETLGNKNTYARSVLVGTKILWKDRHILRTLNRMLWPPVLGAFTGLRVDLIDRKPLKTPIPAPVKSEIKAG
ncbi:class I SAM-dependent methyltransferase [Desulfonatronospira sp.]|uniref:class I SAM-dependent methyltransferase n=1 Tax=Desulfonatronospira sp. TaxID=1962951 RepID=UPI0025C5DF4B|nr:class I SAM-dependent methyltransferase [Desulfonatronospira sp.]